MSPQDQYLSIKINKAAWALGLTIITTFGSGAVFIGRSYVNLQTSLARQEERYNNHEQRFRSNEEKITKLEDWKDKVTAYYLPQKQQ